MARVSGSIPDSISTTTNGDGMSHEEASEYWEQSIVKEWVGTDTPAFLFKKEEQNERA